MKKIQLLEEDVSCFFFAPATSTINFYNGKIDETYLKNKLRMILTKNPWLTSRIVSDKKITSLFVKNANIYLNYNEIFNLNSIDQYFIVLKNKIPINEKTSYESIVKSVKSYLVPRNSSCTNKDQALFKVIVLPDTYGLIISMSHILGDAHTFYKIHQMLDISMNESDIPILNSTRYQKFSESLNLLIGKEQRKLTFSLSSLIGIIKTLLLNLPPKILIRFINQPVVNESKNDFNKKHDKEVAFISTNDIITSHFMQLVDCDYASMNVELREKMNGLSEYHAGNYFAIIYGLRNFFAKPEHIRKYLSSIHPLGHSALPSHLTRIKGKVAFVTSWLKISHHLLLPDTELILHLPLYDNNFPGYSIINFFSPKPTEIAVLILCKTKKDFPSSIFLGDEILPHL